MKKIYIAGKIGNLPFDEVKKNFAEAKEQVKEMGFEPVSPLDLPHNHGKTWGEYMCEDLRAMLDCDGVFALRNARHSPGATIEIETAVKVGLTVYHQQELIERQPA